MNKGALASLDANLLVALDALIEERNVARASRRVGLSASAMSHTLARVRELMDDPILVRAGRSMVLTPRAAQLAPALHEGLSILSKALAKRAALDLQSEQRSLRIAAVDFAQNHVVQSLASALRAEAPGVTLIVLTAGPTAFEELKAGELDFVIAAHGPVRGTLRRTLVDEPFVCVVRRKHPVLQGKLTMKRFAALDHVMVSPRGRIGGATDVVLRRHGLSRRVVLVLPTFSAAALTVASSDLIMTCAERSALQSRAWFELEMLSPPMKLAPFSLGMFWHARSEHDAFSAWVRTRLGELAKA